MFIFYFDIEGPEPSPTVPVFVSVGPSTLQTESSGVRDGSASVTSTSWVFGVARVLRCFELKAYLKIKVMELCDNVDFIIYWNINNFKTIDIQ